ncbi:cytochrome c oxidase assembly protein [Planotetraspora sp. GP83]|uniref:cytochrome c oxidase assembly protein n=1 Tax=Planotetraspora sp. GP83 TaxID=3156264 RepID=UPI0035178080
MRYPNRRQGALAVAGILAAALAVLLLALWFGGGRPRPTIEGLPSPGTLTTFGLPLIRLVHDICAVGTAGTLLAAVALARGTGSPAAITRSAGRWALGWAVSAALTLILTLSDFLGLPIGEALRSGVLPTFLFYIPQGQAFVLVTLLALIIAIGAFLPLGAWGRALLLGVAIFAVLPPAYVGHSASAADHNLAISSLMLHIAAVTVWVGGLFGLVTVLRGSADLVLAVRRFSTLALCCFVAVGVSGTINAWIRVGSVAQAWQSRYGILVLAKVIALIALGWFGRRHRRTTIAALETRATRTPFLRLATGEIAVMLATIGLAVALSRTAPPQPGEGLLHEHEVLGYAVPPLTPSALVFQTRPDPIVLLAFAGAAVAYLAGARRLARRGQAWPIGRTASWLAGLLVLLYGLAGGVGAYGPAVFSVHAVQYALLGAVGPALLVLGAPLTLYQEANPLARDRVNSAAGRALSHPGVALGLYAAPYLALYLTGLFELAQSSLAVRLALQTLVVASAAVFLAVAMGVDPLPRAIGPVIRTRMLVAAIAVQAWIALLLMAGPLQGPGWYAWLALPWAPEREHDQRLGALLGAGLAMTTIAILAMLLLGRWRSALRRVSSPASAAT